MRPWRVAPLLLCACLMADSNPGYQAARRKIDLIASGRAAAGSRISLTEDELNAYVRASVPPDVARGLRSPRITLGPGAATGTARVDFLKLRNARGIPTNWLLSQFLAGERPVKVTARLRSARGQAVVEVEQVEIAGLSVRGSALDFLIRNFVLPYYPGAKLGEPFDLGYGIERLEVEPGGVGVVIEESKIRLPRGGRSVR